MKNVFKEAFIKKQLFAQSLLWLVASSNIFYDDDSKNALISTVYLLSSFCGEKYFDINQFDYDSNNLGEIRSTMFHHPKEGESICGLPPMQFKQGEGITVKGYLTAGSIAITLSSVQSKKAIAERQVTQTGFFEKTAIAPFGGIYVPAIKCLKPADDIYFKIDEYTLPGMERLAHKNRKKDLQAFTE